VLEGLEGDVTKTLQSIQKGIALLDQRRAELTAQPQAAPDDEGYAEDDDWEDEPEDAAAPARS
jgi:hypothetical protein